jgi:AcrR family transcriptional regulator
MSLRQAKRQKLRQTILENAIALFRARGFEATRVREIAERCEISEATFFNYFSTKDAVLGAWVYERLADDFSRAAAGASGSLRSALRGLSREVAVAIDAEREFARGAWGRVRLPGFPAPAPVVSLVAAAQRSGELRRDVPAAELASLLLSVTATSVSSWLAETGESGAAQGATGRDRSVPDASLEQRLRRALDLVLDGSRRRHERVRAGVARRQQASDFA